EPLIPIPNATVFILGVSILLALVSIWATNRFTDQEQLKKDMEEVKEWQSKFNEARKSQDPQQLQEVMDSQSRMMRLQSGMMMARCKPMMIYYIPFFLIFSLLQAIYGVSIVAIVPFNAQDLLWFLQDWIGFDVQGSGFGLTYFGWYMLCGLGLGNIIRRAAGQSAM
ncbi:MAG: EMC3/TMCO1 family protein, partial [Candidatus Thorarchaeota archaeon]|nr:EMC3/TMCO1 family protein [Candidatus Thorarchaeota archaeon]